MSTEFFSLKVKAIKSETNDATSVIFEIPDNLKELFEYQHGQYLTLKFNLNGEEARRAYSLCTSALVDDAPAVTVKRVAGGLVSNHINDQLKAGDEIEVMPPQGRFTVGLNPDHKKDYFLIGSGSGITPLLSIAKSVLECEPKSRVAVFYGNRNEDSILFKDDLARLEQRYAGQLKVEHILSKPKSEKASGLFGAFKKAKIDWDGAIGRIDAKKAATFVDKHSSGDGREAEFFICGPSGMMENVESLLKGRGVDDKHIHIEWFTTETSKKKSTAGAAADGAKVFVTLNKKEHEIVLKDKESILDAMRRMNLDPPYSCLAGACSTCMAKVTEGEVIMENVFAIDDDEVANGYILTCQSKPATDVLKINYDL